MAQHRREFFGFIFEFNGFNLRVGAKTSSRESFRLVLVITRI